MKRTANALKYCRLGNVSLAHDSDRSPQRVSIVPRSVSKSVAPSQRNQTRVGRPFGNRGYAQAFGYLGRREHTQTYGPTHWAAYQRPANLALCEVSERMQKGRFGRFINSQFEPGKHKAPTQQQQGKMCCGRTPMETLVYGKQIWLYKKIV